MFDRGEDVGERVLIVNTNSRVKYNQKVFRFISCYSFLFHIFFPRKNIFDFKKKYGNLIYQRYYIVARFSYVSCLSTYYVSFILKMYQRLNFTFQFTNIKLSKL